MRNTDRLLRLKKKYPTIYEKHWAPFEIKENDPTIYEKYLAPLENKANLLTDMRNTERLLRLKKNDPTIY